MSVNPCLGAEGLTSGLQYLFSLTRILAVKRQVRLLMLVGSEDRKYVGVQRLLHRLIENGKIDEPS